MPEMYLFIVVLLFILAISDLIVGVSNDAVNFLNSAIGSKVASRKTIMIIAGIGILIGATFSSGMMEVARKGIFNPEHFFFGEIIMMFLAVMLTDIILLDFFNTIGLPTSTTVSIVFELLGAAVVMSVIKIISNGESLSAVSEYINSSQALLIISGIFLSVGIAFGIGVIVQFISRLIFSFRYKDKNIFFASIWSGLAMTAMTYFLVFKGLKGASFITADSINYIKEEMVFLLSAAFIFWLIVMHILAMRGVNIFRIIVLFGTFALAMAFAGNDLVNFIGVPIAGFESYLAWSASGQDPFSFSMEILQQPVRTQTYLLFIAGLIMIITLWFSRKAQSVTETEVNLSRQSEGHERFNPNLFARSIVKFSIAAGRLLPSDLVQKTNDSFKPLETTEEDKPSFDLIRAGVNLTTASVLIAFATSLKLPLSTTYVSFMVAMGTSLADRAWGRDSAVYRVAGVLNVIGGWFATAFIAFTAAGVFTILIFYFQLGAILFLVALAVFFLSRSFGYHKKKVDKKQSKTAFEQNTDFIAFEKLFEQLSSRITGLLSTLRTTYKLALEGLTLENPDTLDQANQSIQRLVLKNADFQYELFESIKRINEKQSEGSRTILYVYDLEQDIVQSAELIVASSNQHVKNMLSPLSPDQINQLNMLQKEVGEYLSQIEQFISKNGKMDSGPILLQKKRLLKMLEDGLTQQVHGIKEGVFGARNSQLIFKILLETKDMIAISARFIKLYQRLNQTDKATSFF